VSLAQSTIIWLKGRKHHSLEAVTFGGLSQYFIAYDIADDEAAKKRALLLSVYASSTYLLVRNLSAPAKPNKKSLAQLVKLVIDHHQLPPSKIVKRFKFHTRVQKPEKQLDSSLLNCASSLDGPSGITPDTSCSLNLNLTSNSFF